MSTSLGKAAASRLERDVRAAKSVRVDCTNAKDFAAFGMLSLELLVLFGGVAVPFAMPCRWRVVEDGETCGVRFVEEMRLDDFVRERVDPKRLVEWAELAGMSSDLADAVGPLVRP